MVTKTKTTTKKKKPRPTRSRSGPAKPAGIRTLEDGIPYVHGLFYSDPGGGKTRLAGSSPHALIINCDGASGPDSIRKVKGVEVVDCDTIAEVTEIIEFLRFGSHSYEWAWLDTVTLLQQKEMDKVLGDVVAAKPHRDPDVPDVAEYLKVQNRIKRLVREMIGLPMNIGINAHRLRVEDDDDGTVAYWPAITGKLMPQTICGYMGLVGHLEIGYVKDKAKGEKKEVERLRVKKTEKVYAKNRYGGLGAGMNSPTIPKIMQAIAGGAGEEK